MVCGPPAHYLGWVITGGHSGHLERDHNHYCHQPHYHYWHHSGLTRPHTWSPVSSVISREQGRGPASVTVIATGCLQLHPSLLIDKLEQNSKWERLVRGFVSWLCSWTAFIIITAVIIVIIMTFSMTVISYEGLPNWIFLSRPKSPIVNELTKSKPIEKISKESHYASKYKLQLPISG